MASNADMILVGDISLAQARHLAEDVANGLPTGEKVVALTPAADSVPHQQYIPFPVKHALKLIIKV